MDVATVLDRLRAMGDPASIVGRARFGIPETDSFGVRLPQLRRYAKELGRDARLAEALWRSGWHEARLLATLVADPARFTQRDAERWLADVRSWDLCDGCALNLFDRTEWAWDAVVAWAAREDEWVKRAAFATLAGLATHRKDADDARFLAALPLIEREAGDARNYVKKGVSWALRGIGKRSPALRKHAVAAARRLAARDEPAARWVGRDALRELV